MQLSFYSMMLVASGVSGGMSGASKLLHDYSSDGQGMAMTFSGASPTLRITDTTTPSNNWDSGLGTGYTIQDFFKSRSFTSYTGPVSTGKRLMQADGYIKPCRHNLFTMSNKFASSAWAKTNGNVTGNVATSPDGAVNASKLYEQNATTSHVISQLITIPSGVIYTFSVYAKAGERSWLKIGTTNFGTGYSYFDLTNGVVGTALSGHTISMTSVGSGWYRCSVTATSTSTSATIFIGVANADSASSYAGDGASGIYVYGSQVNAGAILDYVSSEAHNLCLRSEDFSSASWTKNGMLAFGAGSTADAVVAPDGTTTADLLTEDTSTGEHRVYQSITCITSSPQTFSVYAKAKERTLFALYYSSASNPTLGATFNLSNGTSISEVGGATTYGTPTITAVGNGWYRCSLAFTPTVGSANNFQIRLVSTDTTVSYTGDGTSGIYLWGARSAYESTLGKYVATTAAAVYNPHFDIPVEYNTDGTVKALTREEARTNIITYSDFSSFWLTQLLTKTNGQTDAGGTSIGALLECTANEVASVFQNFTVSAATAYTVSYYAKMVSGTGYARCLMYNATDGQVDGSDIAINATTWTRVTATFTPTVTSTNFYLSNGSDAAARDFYICFPQIEAGSTASSVIITGSAAVTRAADHIYWATTIAPFSTSEVTLYGKELILNTPSSTDTICALNANGSYGAGGGLLMRITSLISSQVGGNSSSVAKAISPAATVGGTVKVAGGAKVSTTTQAVTNSGQAVATDATCDWTGTSNRVVIGNIQSGSQPGRQGLVEFMLLPTYDTTVMQNVTA